jgi:prepilin-type N-terminal cleavage/methylation domain-containing protein
MFKRDNEHGFTLIELMVVMSITTVLLGLGAFAVRNFWLVRSLSGGQDEIASQMRAVQSKVMAESNPLIYGIGFREGTSEWQIVRYRAAVGTTPASCVGDGTRRFDAKVTISDVDFETTLAGQDVSAMVGLCDDVIAAPPDGFVFFLPRGLATAGTVTIRQSILDRTATVEVFSLSGRVREL